MCSNTTVGNHVQGFKFKLLLWVVLLDFSVSFSPLVLPCFIWTTELNIRASICQIVRREDRSLNPTPKCFEILGSRDTSITCWTFKGNKSSTSYACVKHFSSQGNGRCYTTVMMSQKPEWNSLINCCNNNCKVPVVLTCDFQNTMRSSFVPWHLTLCWIPILKLVNVQTFALGLRWLFYVMSDCTRETFKLFTWT